MVMNSGGLRSLVATALVLSERPGVRVSLLHIVDGRDNAVARRDHVRRQITHFELPQFREIHLPHLYSPEYGRTADGTLITRLTMPQMLLSALSDARLRQAQRLVWAHAVNADSQRIATATEQMQLIEHLSDGEDDPMPHLSAPLLEMTDQQVVELGSQMNVPWSLAWACQRQGNNPCRVCGACRRRSSAFEAAGLEDPIDKPVAISA